MACTCIPDSERIVSFSFASGARRCVLLGSRIFPVFAEGNTRPNGFEHSPPTGHEVCIYGDVSISAVESADVSVGMAAICLSF